MKRITPFRPWVLWALVALGALYFIFALVLVSDLVQKAVFCTVAVVAVAVAATDLYRQSKDEANRRNDR